jgi:hypothetical protein
MGQSQTITGTVKEKSGGEMPGATVLLLSLPDSAQVAGKTSDLNGLFAFDNVNPGSYVIRVSFIGYLRQDRNITVGSALIPQQNFVLLSDAVMIDEAVVQELQERVTMKGDTTVYNADAFKTNPDATVEDLIKKMPGIADEGGEIKAQGETVTKVLVDGKEFFGSDTKAAIKNLPADMVKSIEVFDQLSDQSRFTGVNDGNTSKTINIVTKAGIEKGQFGRLYAGYGTGDRYAAGGNINFFKGNRRISLIGMSNNINQQNFTSDEISSVTGSQASSGGRGGGGMNWMRGNQPFTSASGNGINTTHSLGLNYTEDFGKKLKVRSGYFFNARDNETLNDLTRNFFTSASGNQFYTESGESRGLSGNHKFTGRMEWEIDSLTSLIFTPNITYSTSETRNTTTSGTTIPGDTLINSSLTDRRSQSERWNMSSGLLLQRKFMKPRRTASVDLNTSFSPRTGETDFHSENYFFAVGDTTALIFDQLTIPESYNASLRADFSYTEPLGEKGILQFNYRPSYSLDNSDNITYDVSGGNQLLDTLFSNRFDNVIQAQEVGVRYRYADDTWNFSFGGSGVRTTLTGDQTFPRVSSIEKPFLNFLPEIRGRYNINKFKSVGFSYRGSNQLPAISQLQNLLNNTNPLQLSIGNPDLEQSYTHRLFTRYSGASEDRTKSFFVMLSAWTTADYIGSSLFIAPSDTLLPEGIFLSRGAQLTRQVNLDKNWGARTYASYGFPLLKLKSNLNISGALNFSQIPGLINDQLNLSRNLSGTTNITLASNISEKIDFTLSSAMSASRVVNTIQPQADFSFLQHELNAKAVWMFTKNWTLSSDASNFTFQGLEGGFSQTFWLWNAGLGYRIAKKNTAELKLSVFDILGQNTSINREITDTFVEDSQTRVLTRFLLLSFNYTLKKANDTQAPASDAPPPGIRPGGYRH